MKKLYVVSAILSSLLLSSQAIAQTVITSPIQTPTNTTPSRDSLVRLAQIMNAETETKNGFKTGFMQTLMTSAMSSKNTDTLTPKQRLEVEKLLQEYGDNVMREVYTPAFSQWMVEQYMVALADTYSQQEVNAMIAFYQTDVGQKIITKQTPFMQNVTRRMASEEMLKQANFEKIGTKYAQVFEKKLKIVLKK